MSEQDDDRLLAAGQRVGLYFGCDTPDHMADEIDRLRADNARLREALEDAFDYVLELSSIKRGDAQLDGYCTELAQFLDREFGIDEAAPDDKKDTP